MSKDVNLMQLQAVAAALGDLLPQVVFVGGSTTVLLVDEAGHHGIRKTDDVDVIVNVASRVEYHAFSGRLHELEFREDTEGPICRWRYRTGMGEVKLDVMPVDEKILGFSNRWYKAAIGAADNITLPGGLVIRVVSPAYFIATKFEAFAGRGKGDYFSHDLEDIVFVMENRQRLIVELMDAPQGLKQYFSEQATKLLNEDFMNVLPGLLNNPASAKSVENSLKIMSGWGN